MQPGLTTQRRTNISEALVHSVDDLQFHIKIESKVK